MIANFKVVNYKVIQLFKICNFHFNHFSIWGYSKILNFKCKKFKRNFSWIDYFKWERCQLQSYTTFDIYNFHFDCLSTWAHLKIRILIRNHNYIKFNGGGRFLLMETAIATVYNQKLMLMVTYTSTSVNHINRGRRHNMHVSVNVHLKTQEIKRLSTLEIRTHNLLLNITACLYHCTTH
jgi:hypothetical protein